MEFFGFTLYGPQNYIGDLIKDEYREPESKEEVPPLMQKILSNSSCPEKIQRPDFSVIRLIDCYIGRVNGFAYGSSQRFNKMKRKGVVKPAGPSDIYRLPPTTSSEEKRDNSQQTGSAGGKKWRLDETDDIVLSIIGKNTPVLAGLPVPESSGTQAALQIQDTNSQSIPQNPQNNANSTNEYCKSAIRLKKEKIEAEILLIKEKTEIAKREKYKLDLELFKLEKELNMMHSSYTEPYHVQNIVQIDVVQLVDNEQGNVQLSRAKTT